MRRKSKSRRTAALFGWRAERVGDEPEQAHEIVGDEVEGVGFPGTAARHMNFALKTPEAREAIAPGLGNERAGKRLNGRDRKSRSPRGPATRRRANGSFA